jgi:hypothetical protein
LLTGHTQWHSSIAPSTLFAVSERSWQEELHQYLEERFCLFANALGQPRPSAGLRIGPPLGIDEAKYFMRGVEAEVFTLNDQGDVQSSLIRAGKSDAAEQGSFPIFAASPPPLRLCRRLVCVLSTAAALILDRGWLEPQVELAAIDDPEKATAADIIITSLDERLLAAVVAKRTAYEVDKLRSDLNQCCRRGPHSEQNCGFPQNHRTFEFISSNQPPYLWAVAPDGEICFQLTYQESGTIDMLEFHSLPPRSLLELLPNL